MRGLWSNKGKKPSGKCRSVDGLEEAKAWLSKYDKK
jgi:hypothetical protein